jgi:hypothetical protein
MNNSPYQEIWVEGPNDQLLCALVNDDRGWLMYLREPGDAGFSSRNPDYDGALNTRIDYILSNGQLDSYRAAWAYPVDVVMQAIAYFKSEGTPPSFIHWYNDSNDDELPWTKETQELKSNLD